MPRSVPLLRSRARPRTAHAGQLSACRGSLVCAEVVVETGRIHTRPPSGARVAGKVSYRLVVDDTDADDIATRRTGAHGREIAGNLFVDVGPEGLSVAEIGRFEVDKAGAYDLWGCRAGRSDP